MFIPSRMYTRIRSDKLGFTTPMDDSGFKKRKGSVDSWAGSTADTLEFYNEPIEGFKILTNVTRGTGGWFGNKNIVWTVEDPRGFKIQISSNNLESLIESTTINHGIVEAACVYVRDGSANAIVPVNTPEYQECINATQLKNSKVSNKNVKCGDTVVLTDGRELIFVGKFNIIGTTAKSKKLTNNSYRPTADVTDLIQAQRYILRGISYDGSRSYVFYADVKIAEIKERCASTQASNDVMSDLLKDIDNGKLHYGSNGMSIYVKALSSKPINLANSLVVTELTPADIDDAFYISEMKGDILKNNYGSSPVNLTRYSIMSKHKCLIFNDGTSSQKYLAKGSGNRYTTIPYTESSIVACEIYENVHDQKNPYFRISPKDDFYMYTHVETFSGDNKNEVVNTTLDSVLSYGYSSNRSSVFCDLSKISEPVHKAFQQCGLYPDSKYTSVLDAEDCIRKAFVEVKNVLKRQKIFSVKYSIDADITGKILVDAIH